jgi:hypothetical protein
LICIIRDLISRYAAFKVQTRPWRARAVGPEALKTRYCDVSFNTEKPDQH